LHYKIGDSGGMKIMPKSHGKLELREESTSVTAAQPSFGVPVAIPPPENFHMGDNFDRWESQVRDCLQLCSPRSQRYILFSLVNGEVYDQIYREVEREEVTDITFQRLRTILVPPRPLREFRNAFRYCVQKSTETARRYATELHKLAAQAYPHFDAETREQLVLFRFMDGVRSPAAVESLDDAPATTMAEAIDRATRKENYNNRRTPPSQANREAQGTGNANVPRTMADDLADGTQMTGIGTRAGMGTTNNHKDVTSVSPQNFVFMFLL
uniref:Retrotrans_gag domain-containing protein n=1 Tax=Echinostoma caproni TaxID=27848 RepID=A0A183BBC1_9TREM